VTAGIVSMAFDDHQSQDADARNTHLKLRGQKLDLLVEVMQDAVATKVSYFNVKCPSRQRRIDRFCIERLVCNSLNYAVCSRCDCTLGEWITRADSQMI